MLNPPIIAAAMNQISDGPFAVACAEAGLFPSISLFRYYYRWKIDFESLIKDIILFQSKSKSDLIFSMLMSDIFNDDVMKVLRAFNLKILELEAPTGATEERFSSALQALKAEGFTLIQKILQYNPETVHRGFLYKYHDMLMIKGNEAAGSVKGQSTSDLFDAIKKDFPDKQIIVSGGISTKQQIDDYLSRGAVGVAIGTLIAMSKESPISQVAKERMLQTTFEEAKNSEIPGKNALLIGKFVVPALPENTEVRIGRLFTDDAGLIYAGAAINQIKQIRPLKEIVADLTG
jgi:hypothetical protein